MVKGGSAFAQANTPFGPVQSGNLAVVEESTFQDFVHPCMGLKDAVRSYYYGGDRWDECFQAFSDTEPAIPGEDGSYAHYKVVHIKIQNRAMLNAINKSIPSRNPATCLGSIIHVDNRVLRESIPLTGTGVTLAYSSERVQGYRANFSAKVNFVGGTTTSEFTGVRTSFLINGQELKQDLPYEANLSMTYSWDGLDENGLPVEFETPALVRAEYTNPDRHEIEDFGTRNLATLPSEELYRSSAPIMVAEFLNGTFRTSTFASKLPPEVHIAPLVLGTFLSARQGLGQWTLSNVHAYGRHTQTLYFGNGQISRDVVARTLPNSNIQVVDPSGDLVYEFSPGGLHLKTLSGLTGVLLESIHYNAQAQVISIEDAHGLRLIVERDAQGVATAIISPFGVRTELDIENGLLLGVSNSQQSWRLAYATASTQRGLLTRFERPSGTHSNFSYNAQGELLADLHSGGSGWVLDFLTDNQTLMRSTTNRATNISSSNSARDAAQMSIAPNGVLTSTSFNRQTEATTVQGHYSDFVQNSPDPRFAIQLPSSHVHANGPVVRQQNFIRQVSAMAGATDTWFQYHTLTTTSSDAYAWEETQFDLATRTLTTRTAGGRVATSFLDSLDRVIRTQIGNDAPTFYHYDSSGRLERIIEGEASPRETLLTYSEASGDKPASLQNPRGEITRFFYDDLQRLIRIQDPNLNETILSYAPNGEIQSVRPAGRMEHQFLRNALDLVSAYVPPSLTPNDLTQFAYDLDKMLTSVTRATGEIVSYARNLTSGELEQIQTAQGSYEFTHTSGKLTSARSPAGIRTDYLYEGGTIVHSRIDEGPLATSHFEIFFNNFGRMVTTRVRSSQGNSDFGTVGIEYDADDLISAIGPQHLTRDTLTGRVTRTTMGVVEDEYGYNAFGELETYRAKTSGVTFYEYTLIRDAAGGIVGKNETSEGVTTLFNYGFDPAGRLITVHQNGTLVLQNTYDANGHRTSVQVQGSALVNSQTDAQDRIMNFGQVQYSQNADGQLTSRLNTVNGAVANFNYDAMGNLRSADLPAQAGGRCTVEYLPDAHNRRFAKKLNGQVEEQYIYQDQLMIAGVIGADGTLKKRFGYSVKAHSPDFMLTPTKQYRIVSDHLGSPRFLVNSATGEIKMRREYDVYGKLTRDTRPDALPQGFAGGIQDRDTKLVRFGARDYDPETARWTAKDPIGFSGGDPNLYGYVMQDPVNAVDPSGLFRNEPWSGTRPGNQIIDPSYGNGGGGGGGLALALASVAQMIKNNKPTRTTGSNPSTNFSSPLACNAGNEDSDDEDKCRKQLKIDEDFCNTYKMTPFPGSYRRGQSPSELKHGKCLQRAMVRYAQCKNNEPLSPPYPL
ncbi:MAG TPA: RHS repeat-associated core domain-containing protein [Pseudobdellovibrionaceae bacterium]|nr:RHS repeat-associated core domain-containing protein [Pseudobdellovibrionaceae bacterium]